ncbi:MAG: Glu-tRNA(Gln) amidotransferase subunit GatD [Thermoproteales archaeon]|nr:Glu-tRNA(Gln) amidotransferase subunit GatD [Thermoproteales archaeon]
MVESHYSPKVRELMKKYGVEIFDRVNIILGDGRAYTGIILPRPRHGDPNSIILKLDNGYNVGFSVNERTKIELIEKMPEPKLAEVIKPKISPGLPMIMMLGTGGTIASRIDYRSGAVYSFFTAEEIYSMIPELIEIANVDTETVFSIFSEDMTPQNWTVIAEKVYRHLKKGDYTGIVIAHGTDTMGYTAAALSFAVRNLPYPVILVGAQRSSDRPSTDTIENVIAAVTTAAYAPFAEVAVVMHGSMSDDFCLAHRGTKVRKCHTSRRDAFRTINGDPLAIIRRRQIKMLTDDYLPRDPDRTPVLENSFEDKVILLKFYPGMKEEIIELLVDAGYRGIVLEGTGLGHVRNELISVISKAVKDGVAFVMTSQCIWGRINMNVYSTGVDLLKAGVIPGEDMLPETAFVKLSWILAKTDDLDEVRKLMLTNIAGEINYHSNAKYYPEVYPHGRT